MPEDRNVVVIDAGGQLRLGGEAQQRLAGHSGRFRVLPTTGEIIILQRIVEHRGASSMSAIAPGRVTLAGEVDAVGGLVDVINFILSNQWSGQLAVIQGAQRKTLYFRRGDVRTAASNVPEDRLGAVLYRYGVVTEEQLQSALGAAPGAKLGHALVEQGLLSPHALYTYVRKQVEEIFFSVLTLQAGAFYFYRTDEEHGPASQLSLSTKELLFEGVRRIDELSYFRQKLPHAELLLQQRQPTPAQKLDPHQERLLRLVDGTRDLRALARHSHLGEFETTKVLYQLLTAGFIEPRPQPVVAMPPPRPGDSPHETFGTVIDAFNDIYRKIFVAVSQRGHQQQLRTGLDSFFASVAEFAPLFVGLSIEDDGSLFRDALLANLGMAPTDNKLDYLHRGLKELLFFELFTAGEAVDRREQAALHQRLDQILRDQGGGGREEVREMIAEPEDASEGLF